MSQSLHLMTYWYKVRCGKTRFPSLVLSPHCLLKRVGESQHYPGCSVKSTEVILESEGPGEVKGDYPMVID